MRPLNRKPVNKYKDSKKFNYKAEKTKAINVRPKPMRGGFRL